MHTPPHPTPTLLLDVRVTGTLCPKQTRVEVVRLALPACRAGTGRWCSFSQINHLSLARRQQQTNTLGISISTQQQQPFAKLQGHPIMQTSASPTYLKALPTSLSLLGALPSLAAFILTEASLFSLSSSYSTLFRFCPLAVRLSWSLWGK